MKDNHNTDKLLRDALDGYRPVPDSSTKEKFLNRAAASAPAQTHMNRLYLMLLLGALLLAIMAGLFYIPVFHSNNTVSENQAMTSSVSEPGTTDSSPATVSATDTMATKANNLTQSMATVTIAENVAKPVNTRLIETTETTHPEYVAQDDEVTDTPVSEIEVGEAQVTSAGTEAVAINQPETITPLVTEEPLPVSDEKAGDSPTQSKAAAGRFGLGIFYRPEIVFNIIENNKLIHNAGLELQYRFFDKRYMLRSGLGLSLSKGYYEYAVAYNEYLGSYNHLDSITFTLAANKFHLIPTYYQSERAVFDTGIQVTYSRVYKQHLYLQIPLEFGYDFFRSATTSLGFRLGPTLSLLIGHKPIQFVYDPGNDNIVQINQITPDRIRSNWQVSGGLNFTRYVGRYMIEAEPRVAYYFNSVYEKANKSKSPISVSVRIGLGFW
ncbi:MAG: hypothetical protein KGZ82_02810 [Bacteroidales bacterium]|nr:hypothetical protein [Bacteroidales bacterium]